MTGDTAAASASPSQRQRSQPWAHRPKVHGLELLPPGGPARLLFSENPMKLNNPLRHPFRVPRVEKPRAEGRFYLPNGRRLGVAKAIIERPRGMGLLYRFSTDSPSAQGIQR